MRKVTESWDTRTRENPVPRPASRRLRGYAFDPSLSLQLDTAVVNECIFCVPWEDPSPPGGDPDDNGDDHVPPRSWLTRGPVGEYLEVIDYDPASDCCYAPIDLNHPLILAQDGLAPTEGNPQFHQQMVYAVAMTTITNFERALGRRVLWASPLVRNAAGEIDDRDFIQRLRIHPHALREANAYYSPDRVALLFGYFPVSRRAGPTHLPGGTVFTCLSHDIIAHETTHALLDGMHRRFIEASNPDVLAFHEAFADIVALFQHFTFPDVLRHQIALTRGNLRTENLLGQLAREFGQAIGNHGALRDAIGTVDAQTGAWSPARPDPADLQRAVEPHERGAILVAAVFDAFIEIFHRRVADLVRIATSGTGVLGEGAIHPDLVGRLADEASTVARSVLDICIRALDYCPPVDITFGDYLRALITADSDLVPEDALGYRIAFIEAFRRRGIHPRNVRTLSVDSLRWNLATELGLDLSSFQQFVGKLREQIGPLHYASTRKEIFEISKGIAAMAQGVILKGFSGSTEFERLTGLRLNPETAPKDITKKEGRPALEVHSIRAARRVGPGGVALNQVIVTMTQKRNVRVGTGRTAPVMPFRGGCTLILDLDTLELRYAVRMPIDDEPRLEAQKEYMASAHGLRGVYSVGLGDGNEPFALLHRRF